MRDICATYARHTVRCMRDIHCVCPACHVASFRNKMWDICATYITYRISILKKVNLEKKKTDYSEAELKEMAMARIEEISKGLEIYTDGSRSGKQENGGAGVYVWSKVKTGKNLPIISTLFFNCWKYLQFFKAYFGCLYFIYSQIFSFLIISNHFLIPQGNQFSWGSNFRF